jgi:hypothetical protein
MTLLVPTLRVGMPSWPLRRPEALHDARASRLAPTPEPGSQSERLVREPYTSRRGQRKSRVTIVAVDSKRLVSQHIREALENDSYDVQPIKLPGRGIMKWLFG